MPAPIDDDAAIMPPLAAGVAREQQPMHLHDPPPCWRRYRRISACVRRYP
jgi:hypothetical protein